MVDFKALVPWKSRSEVPATRNDSFDPFVAFRREVDRVFEDFFSGSRTGLATWQNVAPAIGIEETDNELVITAELPGVSEKDIEVSLSGDVLTVRGEKKAEHEQRHGDGYYTERRFGSFVRSVRLPFEAKDGDVSATFKDGVLTIQVPKPAELQKPIRRIEVKSA